MEFTIDITVKEARALRVISKSQGISIEVLMQRLIRRFVTGQIRGKYRNLFDKMNYNQLENVFGTIEDLYGWSSSSYSLSSLSSLSSDSQSSSSFSSQSSESSQSSRSSSSQSSKSSRSSSAGGNE